MHIAADRTDHGYRTGPHGSAGEGRVEFFKAGVEISHAERHVVGDGIGIARGLSLDGGLHVEFRGALETVYAGEVTLGHVESKEGGSE